MKPLLVLFFIILSYNYYSQENSNKTFEFLPQGIHFMPLKANHQEAKIGIQYYINDDNLKIDIGNSIDVVGFNFTDGKSKLTLGLEFMTYVLSTSYEQKRLQIDAVDGFFGGNAVFSKEFEKGNKFYTRFRIIHNSAHLVDGHYNRYTKTWLNGKEPMPYAKDFGELTVTHEINRSNYLMYYGGISYAVLIRPLDQKKFTMSAGTEYAIRNPFGKLFGKDENLFIAYHFGLVGIPKYIGNHSFMTGFKFGNWQGKGLLLYAAYYSGNNAFSEYFRDRVERTGVGFALDFP